jgi:hypothetical protein
LLEKSRTPSPWWQRVVLARATWILIALLMIVLYIVLMPEMPAE